MDGCKELDISDAVTEGLRLLGQHFGALPLDNLQLKQRRIRPSKEALGHCWSGSGAPEKVTLMQGGRVVASCQRKGTRSRSGD